MMMKNIASWNNLALIQIYSHTLKISPFFHKNRTYVLCILVIVRGARASIISKIVLMTSKVREINLKKRDYYFVCIKTNLK